MASLHTWVINLDRAPERLARIGARLDALGVPWTRFPAVEGKLLTAAEQAARLDQAGFERRHGMTPSLGELGCYLSHVRLMPRSAMSSNSCPCSCPMTMPTTAAGCMA
ncbi:MAG: glycosyltransferase family 25 protein [Betaproteobacteria bacterium]|nr:glycosyltransferase family 25 protein [Betaproteobacteria bacterium]